MRVKLNHANIERLLRGERVTADLYRRAERVAAKAGPGMVPSSAQGKSRARASVVTVTYQARRAEATTRALTRAFDAARG